MESATYRTPKPVLVSMQVSHLGEIAFRLQFFAAMLLYAGLISMLMSLLLVVVLITISLASLGLIYAIFPGMIGWWSAIDKANVLTDFIARGWVFLVPVTCVLSLLSIICLSFDKQQKHVAKIVFSSIVLVATGVFVIAMLGAK